MTEEDQITVDNQVLQNRVIKEIDEENDLDSAQKMIANTSTGTVSSVAPP